MSCCSVNYAQLSGLVSSMLSDQTRLLIWAPLTKTTDRVNLKKTLFLFILLALCCCYPTILKIAPLLFLCLPRCAPGIFFPLGVERDLCCSVKSAAALMARPSRAVIQTSKLLEYKSCPEFALAGSSSRGHRDYLFISNLSGHGSLLSAGDSGMTRYRHLICAVAWRARGGSHECLNGGVRSLSAARSWRCIMEVH